MLCRRCRKLLLLRSSTLSFLRFANVESEMESSLRPETFSAWWTEICIHILINPVLQQLQGQQVMCIYSLSNRNRVSSVSTVTRLGAERPRNCVSILGRCKRHFCSPKSPDRTGAHAASYTMGTNSLSCG